MEKACHLSLASPMKSGKYTAKLMSSDIHCCDNFARMELSPEQLEVRFYERKGALLGKPAVWPL